MSQTRREFVSLKLPEDAWAKVSGCDGKDALTPSQAMAVEQRMRRNGKKVNAYRCGVCSFWHVGSVKPGMK